MSKAGLSLVAQDRALADVSSRKHARALGNPANPHAVHDQMTTARPYQLASGPLQPSHQGVHACLNFHHQRVQRRFILHGQISFCWRKAQVLGAKQWVSTSGHLYNRL